MIGEATEECYSMSYTPTVSAPLRQFHPVCWQKTFTHGPTSPRWSKLLSWGATAAFKSTGSISGVYTADTLYSRGSILRILRHSQYSYSSYSQYSQYSGFRYCSYSQYSQYSGFRYCSYSQYSQYSRLQYCSYSQYSQYEMYSILRVYWNYEVCWGPLCKHVLDVLPFKNKSHPATCTSTVLACIEANVQSVSKKYYSNSNIIPCPIPPHCCSGVQCPHRIQRANRIICIPNPSHHCICLLYTSPSPRDRQKSRMPSSA